MNTEEAYKVIEEDKQKKVSECWSEIAEVLRKYKLKMDVSTVLNGGKITQFINLVPEG